MTSLRVRTRTFAWSRPLVMGVVNANPDSFSDPGTRTTDAVLRHAAGLVAAGAGAVDVGAQSAITGRVPADPGREAAAVAPVVAALVAEWPELLVSVDTYKPAVAEAALDAGAHLVNDVSGLLDPALASLCASAGAGLVVMHTAAPPLVRRQDPALYRDVGAEVAAFLADRIDLAVAAGVGRESIVVDPGVDFAKTPAQSLRLLRDIDAVTALGLPVLLALSRKDFVGALTGRPPAGRDAGTLGAIAALRRVPGQILRVHDVAATVDMLTVLDAVAGHGPVADDLVLDEGLRHESRP
jgi:dihydropteroate synthase